MSYVSWYNDPHQRVYIGWETSELTVGQVRYGTDPANPNLLIDEIGGKTIHIVNITGLSSDTAYYYQVWINGKQFCTGEFRTAPVPLNFPITDETLIVPFRFGLSADIQQKFGPGWFSRFSKVIAEKDYAFMAFVGDFLEEGNVEEWWDLFTRSSVFLNRIPIVPVQGNHDRPRDLNGDGTLEYYFARYFPQTVDQISGTNQYDTHPQFYYSFNWSNVHFQILHVPEVDIDDFNEEGGVNPRDYNQVFTPDHLEWIRNDLAAAQAMPFRITLFHCPITSAGFYGPNFILQEQLLPILHEYNVTVTVHGHAHHFGRGLLPNPLNPGRDLTILNVGNAATPDMGLRPVPETEICAASPSYTECLATASTLRFTTYTLDGAIIDDYTIVAPIGGQ
jgi:hypothetical protein